ncbi:FG-GAP-like repeat-containing protein [Streptomyces sp. NPDC006872]|uniref:FG-GAP-like repeat-containing protein n=1 Tax=Streptomyces sp. NPDC006872 TaxID=3155720 RepID=UPI0033E94475
MGRTALSRARLTAAISSVTLAVAGVTLLPPTAAAAPVAPWTAPTAITGTNVEASVKDVVTAADGSAVALWNQFTTGYERKLYAAVRPAGSDVWGTPTLLATTPTEGGGMTLHASADGTVTAVWWEFPAQTSPYSGRNESRLVSSVLAADKSGWSAPAELVGTDASWGDGGIDVAEASDGTLTAAWGSRADSSSRWEVSAATRGADGSWSAPVRVSTAAVDGAHASAPSVAVTADGTAVVVYTQTAGESIRLHAASRAAGSAEWSASVAVTGTYLSGGAPQVAAAGDGSMTLAWTARDQSQSQAILTAARTPEGAWSPADPLTATEHPVGTPEPLIAPDGDVTLVWVDYAAVYDTRTATRDADSGAWSAVQTLSTAYVPEQYDAVIGDDGTVHALWTQESGTGRVLMESVRRDDAWSTATALPGSQNPFVRGQVSVGGDGTGTAVWTGTANGVDRLYGSRTAWPALAVGSSSIPATAPLKGTTGASAAWAPTWQLSRPASTWSVILTDPAGRTVRTLTGTPDGGMKAAASWNGRTTSGTFAPNGPLTWTLRATQEGAASSVTLASGTVTVTGGAAAARDFGGASATPDGTGDLLTLDSAGTMSFMLGKASTGAFSGKVAGSGWATSTRAVPLGDLNGDRCNDVLVRLSSGAVRLYKPGCNAPLKPTTPYTTLAASGWNQYDVLTSPGDVTKDGRPDLIARNATTGTVYLYKGTSAGKLSARVKLYDNWKTYKKVVGVGDLNGDGVADLIAQDKANNLYRYLGTGNGAFSARVKLFANWGGTYNAVVGVGDLNRDGKADIVARDTGGNLYRQNGNGKGTFGARTLIAKGWGVYKALS